jgi:hypothetical protein
MINLKGKLKTIGIFALGFLTGTILLGGLIVWNYTVMFRELYHIQIISNINTISMIRSGREDKLLKYMEANIPEWVTFADSVLRGKTRLDSLWSIQRYYEKFNLDVPSEIQPILKKLPPPPSTSYQMKKPQERETEPNMPEPNNPPAH